VRVEYKVLNLENLTNSINFKISITHNNEVIEWYLSSLGRSVVKTDTIFNQLNTFLKTLDKNTVDTLFNIIKDIYNDINSSLPISLMFKSIRDRVSTFLSYFIFQDVINFVNFSPEITIPSSFKDSFVSDITKNITRDKTYTRKDYVELVALILILKALLPVFTHYMTVIEGEVGKQYKEDYVFSIINNSQYYESKPLEKLKTYIQSTLLNGAQLSSTSLTISGITIEEHIDILLARTMIRKLLVSDLGGMNKDNTLKVDDNHNPITYTYKFMTQIKRDNEKSNVYDKKESGGNSESGLSILEEVRLQYNIAIGDVVSLEYYIKDITKIANKIDPSLSKELLDYHLSIAHKLDNEMIYEPQIKILQTLFKKYIPPMSLPHLNKQKIIELIGLAKALLWKNNIKVISLLLSSVTKDTTTTIMSGTGSRTRIDPELVSEIVKIFPYAYTLRNSKDKKAKVTNPVLEDIDNLAKQLSDYVWYSSEPLDMVRDALQDPMYADNRIIIPANIRNEIARLFIYCQQF
jgi:hypothetical protein